MGVSGGCFPRVLDPCLIQRLPVGFVASRKHTVPVSHSRRSAIAAMTLAVATLLVGAFASWGRQPDSGVRGRALYGPTCPAERVGQPCTRPYQTTIVIRSEPAGRLVTRTRSSANGYFSVNLFAGRYLLVP